MRTYLPAVDRRIILAIAVAVLAVAALALLAFGGHPAHAEAATAIEYGL